MYVLLSNGTGNKEYFNEVLIAEKRRELNMSLYGLSHKSTAIGDLCYLKNYSVPKDIYISITYVITVYASAWDTLYTAGKVVNHVFLIPSVGIFLPGPKSYGTRAFKSSVTKSNGYVATLTRNFASHCLFSRFLQHLWRLHDPFRCIVNVATSPNFLLLIMWKF